MSAFRDFVRSSWVGRVILIPWRLKNALATALKPVRQALVWAFTSREHYNYTYDLQPLNVRYLTAFVAVVTGQSHATVEKYIREIEQDQQLMSHIEQLNSSAREKFVADPVARFGRRIGWYALVRAMKPRVIVETGVDKGIGSCVLAAALMRNAAEGFPGRLIGMDLNPNAGYLLKAPYDKYGEIVYGDSLESIRALNVEVDLFIHDSDHSAEHEKKELAAIQHKLSSLALVVSDNAEHTSELLDFARRAGRQFLFFAEQPKDHWWPGEGIGVAFTPVGGRAGK